ncbi:MAG: ABC transporter permease [Bacillota bacterium]
MKTIQYFIENLSYITDLTLQHLILIGISIILALIVWISVGIAIRNKDKTANTILSIGSLFMSIPSVALYGILVTIPFFGLRTRSAVFGLILYSMIPIVRNVYTALNEVDPSIIEAAKGMGMSEKQILKEVQLPLALPVIFAGVRVALVMMVGIATLAVFIGEQNLGQLIQQGISRTRTDMVITGAIMVSFIAIGIDLLIGYLKKKIVSPGLLLNDHEGGR